MLWEPELDPQHGQRLGKPFGTDLIASPSPWPAVLIVICPWYFSSLIRDCGDACKDLCIFQLTKYKGTV